VGEALRGIKNDWITTGVVRDANGKRIPELSDTLVSSVDEDTTGLVAYLREIKYGHPRQTGFYGDSHVETKLAYQMMTKGVKNAVVVINNNKGVCKGRDSCSELVEVILPEGYTLTVYHPGAGSPEQFVGKGPGRKQ
jgi:hypothetical protein